MPRPSAPDTGLLAELWSDVGLEFTWPIDKSVHGPVYTDVWFGSVTWSPDERFVAYIADTPPPSSDHKDVHPAAVWALPLQNKHEADSRGPFGEAYVQKRSPALFIADVQEGTVALAAHPSSYHLGQPQWGSSGWIVCTALHKGTATDDDPLPIPDDLGTLYCYNRLRSIVAFKAPATFDAVPQVEQSLTLITNPKDPQDYCSNSPRLSPNGCDLVYIGAPRILNDLSDTYILPHNTTKTMRYVSFADGKFSKPTTLIDVPQDPKHTEFPGLYLHGFVARPWLRSDTLVLTTTWGSSDKIITASFERRDGALISPADLREAVKESSGLDLAESPNPCVSKGSMTLLDVHNGVMLAAASDPASPTQLVIMRDCGVKEKFSTQWVSHASVRASKFRSLLHAQHDVSLVTQECAKEGAFHLSARVFDERINDLKDMFQVTLLLPAESGNGKLTPLAVFPHGGPHTSSVMGFSVASSALLSCGFAVLFINYRGSLGLGQKSLESLLGRIGSQDINEVVQATRWALNEEKFKLDAERATFVGGSHSGFIGAHTSLIPGLFKRTVLRNPVANVATMVGASDIPDWCFAESGLRQEGGGMVADAEQLGVMYGMSPVSRVNQAKREGAYPRTLLLVGSGDKRVPPTQSLEWRRLLTSAFGEGVVSMRWYDGPGHAIDNVPEGDDAWVQALDFLSEVFDEG